MSKTELDWKKFFRVITCWIAVVALLVVLTIWWVSYTRRERALALECWQIFGVEMPTSNTSLVVYRSNKIAAAKVLAQFERQALQHSGNALAFSRAFEVYEACFDPDRAYPAPRP